MIHSITFKNFFSFKDEGILSLVVNDKAPQTEKYIVTGTGERVSRVLSVFGYNASGKTNALKPIAFLKWLIVDAYMENPDAKIPLSPFEFTSEKSPTELSVQFSIERDLYFYDVGLTEEKIISEKLQIKTADKAKFKTLFERVWDNKENKYSWKDNFGLGIKFQDRLRKNASVLATAIRDNHKESIKIFEFWNKINVNVTFAGKIDSEMTTVAEAAGFFDDNLVLKNKADALLRKFDLGLSAVEIKKDTDGNKRELLKIHGVHYGNYHLSFALESSGTKKLFVILRNILKALDDGGVAVLDEFDTDLHPMMSEALLNMFFSRETNSYNAQLIFSAHSPHLLNLLDKYQIALTEKNEKGESEIWRLDEMTGVRLDDNYYAKYLSGAYGGVPDLDL